MRRQLRRGRPHSVVWQSAEPSVDDRGQSAEPSVDDRGQSAAQSVDDCVQFIAAYPSVWALI